MPEPKTHAENRPMLESLLRRVPGFKGYLEKQYRRESDALQRTALADRLERSKQGLASYARQLVDAGAISELPTCDRLRAKLDHLIARLRGAMQGYSGMFDLVRIDEKVLDRVYEHDLALLDKVESLGSAVEATQHGSETPSQVVPKLMAQVAEIDQAWNHREDILKGLE